MDQGAWHGYMTIPRTCFSVMLRSGKINIEHHVCCAKLIYKCWVSHRLIYCYHPILGGVDHFTHKDPRGFNTISPLVLLSIWPVVVTKIIVLQVRDIFWRLTVIPALKTFSCWQSCLHLHFCRLNPIN